jgi:hypothetical protein
MVSAYPVAGTHSAQTAIEQRNVVKPATSNLPYRSLSSPIKGRPIKVPRFKGAVTVEALDALRPSDERAKSDKEYNSTIYPKTEKKPQDNRRKTGRRRKSLRSNGSTQ